MTTERLEILMNRELDGENSADESVRLQDHLNESPAARARYAEMQHAFRTLDEAGALVPPRDLRDRILSAIEQEDESPEAPAARRPVRGAPYRRLGFRPGYAFAAVAGFLLGVLVWQQAGPGVSERDAASDAWLRGSQLESIADEVGGPSVTAIVGGGARGRFRIWRGATSDLVSLDLESEKKIRLELAADLALRFQDLQARPAAAWNLSVGSGAVALEGRGSCTCTFVVEKSGRLVRGLAWRLLADGEVVDRGELSIRERGETP